jgi:ketosteroid isomerase-like protein
MKRQNIEVVLGFLDAIRRGDREAAAGFLHPETFWQGVAPDLACRNREEVLGIFFRRRDDPGVEIERLELIGAERGAVFAIHRPGVWAVASVEIRGVMYHAARIAHGRIVRLADYPDRDQALAAASAENDWPR